MTEPPDNDVPDVPLGVFHINTERTFRGGEVQTILLARELDRRGHRNLLFAQPGSPLARRAQEDGLSVVEISMRGEWDVVSALQIRAAVRRLKPDILHAHNPHAAALALLARWPRKQPAVIASRRVGLPIKKNVLSRLKYSSADSILAISHAVRDGLMEQGLAAHRIHLAESCTDFSRFVRTRPRREVRWELGIPGKAFVVGNVAHFDRHKGQEALIEAFSGFTRRRPESPSYLLLVGEGPELGACRLAASRCNLPDRVIFAGRREDVADLYAAMDVFFLSTLTALEGWSNVLTEAMATGLACVAVRHGVTEERIRNGETGLLVAPDRRDEWVRLLDRLRDDEGLRGRLAEAGRASALGYTPEYLAETTEACYRETLKGSPCRRP